MPTMPSYQPQTTPASPSSTVFSAVPETQASSQTATSDMMDPSSADSAKPATTAHYPEGGSSSEAAQATIVSPATPPSSDQPSENVPGQAGNTINTYPSPTTSEQTQSVHGSSDDSTRLETTEEPAAVIVSLLSHSTSTEVTDPAGAIVSLLGKSSVAQQAPGADTDPSSQAVPTAYGAVVGSGTEQLTAQQTNGGVLIGSTLLSTGQFATISGHQIAVGSSDVTVDGSVVTVSVLQTEQPSQATELQVILPLGSDSITAAYDPGVTSAVVVGGQTLVVGGAAVTLASHVLTLGQSGLVVDGTTTAPLLPDLEQGQGTAILTAGGQTLTASAIRSAPNVVVIGGSTASLDGPAVTLVENTYSVSDSGVVVDDSTTVPVEVAAAGSQGVVITTAGHTNSAFAENVGSIPAVVINGPPGAGTTIEGQPFGLGPDGVVLDSSSTIVMPGPVLEPTATVFVVHSKTYTAYALSGASDAVVVDGITLSAGHTEATVAGETFSLEPSGLVVDGSSTIAVHGLQSSSVLSTHPHSGTSQTSTPGSILSSTTRIASSASRALRIDWRLLLSAMLLLVYR